MKDKGEAITAVVLLGLGLSAIIRSLVIGGSGFGNATCQNTSPGDCILSLFVFFWVVAAILVGSVYLGLLIRRSVRHRHPPTTFTAGGLRKGEEQVLALKPSRSCFVSRGENYFDIFRGGVPPVETVLGESYGLGRRTASSTVFVRARYRLDSARGSYGLESSAPIPDQGLFRAIFSGG